MKSPGVDNKSISRKVRVYDIKNKKLIGTFENTTDAGKFTGVSPRLICSCINRKSKNRKNKLGILLAFR